MQDIESFGVSRFKPFSVRVSRDELQSRNECGHRLPTSEHGDQAAILSADSPLNDYYPTSQHWFLYFLAWTVALDHPSPVEACYNQLCQSDVGISLNVQAMRVSTGFDTRIDLDNFLSLHQSGHAKLRW